jgi:WD40 repeat protein
MHGNWLLLGTSLWDLTPAWDFVRAGGVGTPPDPACKEVPLEEAHNAVVRTPMIVAPGGQSIFGLVCRTTSPPTTEATIWDSLGRCQRHFPFGDWPSIALALAPDGRTSAVSGDKVARLVDLQAEGNEVGRLKLTDYPRALHFSPDGQFLAVAAGRTVWLWEVAGRQLRARFAAFRRKAESLAFSPDGRFLAAGSADGEVRLWEVADGREVACMDWQIGAVHGLAFSPDGMTAAAAGHKKTLVIWDIEES